MPRLLPRATLLLSLLLACGPGDGESDSGESDGENTEVAAACESLCAEQLTCGTTTLNAEECVSACEADIGVPSSECAQAIEALATCVKSSCDDEAACDAELGERDNQCGGRG